MGPYIADFACPAAMVIVELDGSQHGDDAAAVYDARRSVFLSRQGWRVMRFWNHEVLEDIEAVVYAIDWALRERMLTAGSGPSRLAP